MPTCRPAHDRWVGRALLCRERVDPLWLPHLKQATPQQLLGCLVGAAGQGSSYGLGGRAGGRCPGWRC